MMEYMITRKYTHTSKSLMNECMMKLKSLMAAAGGGARMQAAASFQEAMYVYMTHTQI